MLIRSLLGRIL